MSTQHTQPEALWLADEFRPTMPREVMLSWGRDVVAELRRLHEANQELLAALKAADWYIGQLEPFVYGADDNGVHEEHAKVRAAIAKATNF